MSLQEHLEDLKKQQAEAIEREEKEVQELQEESVEEVTEENSEEAEEIKEEAQEEKKEEELDSSGYARLRRENAASKKRAEEAEARAAALEADKKVEVDKQEEPNPIAQELEQMISDHRTTRAEREFQTLEAQFKTNHPDYDAVSKQYAETLFGSIKVQNPRLSPLEIAERTKQALLQQAGEYVRAGYNPIEEMYHDAKELGLNGSQPQKEAEKVEPKPDMKKVAENRKRSAGTAGASGESKSGITREYIGNHGIANEEWMRLPVAERKRLMSL